MIITKELPRRTHRAPDFCSESLALRELSLALARSPETILNTLVEKASGFCRADSAGITLVEYVEGKETLRCHAATGDLVSLYGETYPRDFSPCGLSIDSGMIQLLREPGRDYKYLLEMGLPIHEMLIIPFIFDGKSQGSLWIMSSHKNRIFDGEDARLLQAFADFACAAAHVYKVTAEQREQKAIMIHERERLLSTFMDAPVSISIYRGPNQIIDFANHLFRRTVGIDRELEGKSAREVFPDVGDEFRSVLKNVYEQGRSFSAPEYAVTMDYDKNGIHTERFWNVTYQPTRTIMGKVDGVLACAFEVTEQVESRRKLEEERDVRERFVATLTHDLRTPLMAAKLSAEIILRREGVMESVRHAAKRITRTVDRAADMVTDLLDANLIRAGHKVLLNIQKVNLNSLVKSTLEELKTIHGDRFKYVESEIIEGYWSISGLRRVIENLCANAVKYGDANALITVAFHNRDGLVEISVHNLGQPIPKDEQTTIFDQFRRSNSAKSSSQKGWGLGLTLVKGIAQSLGGEVSVRSDKEYGTEFKVKIPHDSRTRH